MSTVVVLSGGGIKGAVAAGRYARDHDIVLLHVDHGQAAATAQSRALAMLAAYWPNARLYSLALPKPRHIPSSAKAGTVIGTDPAPTHSEDATRSVWLRGLLPTMLAFGAQTALRFGASSVVVGISALEGGEHLGLPGSEAGPDARREVLHSFDIMLEAMLRPRNRIRIETPLIDFSYAQMIKLGQRFEIPWERTHTCEAHAGASCGRCPSCKARAQAFLEAAIRDPAAPTVNAAVKQVAH